MTFHSTPSRAFVGTTKILAGKGAKSKSADGLTGIVIAREESRRTDDRRQTGRRRGASGFTSRTGAETMRSSW